MPFHPKAVPSNNTLHLNQKSLSFEYEIIYVHIANIDLVLYRQIEMGLDKLVWKGKACIYHTQFSLYVCDHDIEWR